MNNTTQHTLWKKNLVKQHVKYQSFFDIFRQNSRIFMRNKTAVFGLVLVLIFLFVCAFGDYIAPYPEDAVGAVNAS